MLFRSHPNPFWGFLAEKGQIDPKRTGMTTLGSPGLSSQSVSGFSAEHGQKKPETDWDDIPGKPKLVIPIRFVVFWPQSAKKNPKRTGMTRLGSPGLSSQSVSGFSCRKGPKTQKRTGMITLGSPCLSSQSVSGFSGRKRPKTPKRSGMTTLGSPGLSPQSVSGFSGRKGLTKTRNGLG